MSETRRLSSEMQYPIGPEGQLDAAAVTEQILQDPGLKILANGNSVYLGFLQREKLTALGAYQSPENPDAQNAFFQARDQKALYEQHMLGIRPPEQ